MVCIGIRIYVRHKTEGQLQIGMLREPQYLGERAAGCRPLVYTVAINEIIKIKPHCFHNVDENAFQIWNLNLGA